MLFFSEFLRFARRESRERCFVEIRCDPLRDHRKRSPVLNTSSDAHRKLQKTSETARKTGALSVVQSTSKQLLERPTLFNFSCRNQQIHERKEQRKKTRMRERERDYLTCMLLYRLKVLQQTGQAN